MSSLRLIVSSILVAVTIMIVGVGLTFGNQVGRNNIIIDNAMIETASIISDSGEIRKQVFEELERKVFSTGGAYKVTLIVDRYIRTVGAGSGRMPLFSISNTNEIDYDDLPDLRIGDELEIIVTNLSEGNLAEKSLRSLGIYTPVNNYYHAIKVRSNGGDNN